MCNVAHPWFIRLTRFHTVAENPHDNVTHDTMNIAHPWFIRLTRFHTVAENPHDNVTHDTVNVEIYQTFLTFQLYLHMIDVKFIVRSP